MCWLLEFRGAEPQFTTAPGEGTAAPSLKFSLENVCVRTLNICSGFQWLLRDGGLGPAVRPPEGELNAFSVLVATRGEPEMVLHLKGTNLGTN